MLRKEFFNENKNKNLDFVYGLPGGLRERMSKDGIAGKGGNKSGSSDSGISRIL